jgi:hypothetical protein
VRLRLRLLATLLSVVWTTIACGVPTPVEILPGMLPVGNEVLKDDFKSNTLGWDIYQGPEGVTAFENEMYKIAVRIPFAEIWANPDPKYSIPNNVIIEVLTNNSGSQDNYFGIICRYQDKNHFYFMIISSDGYYGIGKVKDGQHALIQRTEMPPSDLIKDRSTVKLRAECIGDRLALFADNTLLDEQLDAEFSQGGVGLIAGSYADEVEIFFDNFIVFEARP